VGQFVDLRHQVVEGVLVARRDVPNVPQSEKFEVETEYRMRAAYYGYSIEIDHIVPLEIGGSNNVANLFPEPGSGKANYHVKDELENSSTIWSARAR
jgi:hypothetical protein